MKIIPLLSIPLLGMAVSAFAGQQVHTLTIEPSPTGSREFILKLSAPTLPKLTCPLNQASDYATNALLNSANNTIDLVFTGPFSSENACTNASGNAFLNFTTSFQVQATIPSKNNKQVTGTCEFTGAIIHAWPNYHYGILTDYNCTSSDNSLPFCVFLSETGSSYNYFVDIDCLRKPF